MGVQKIVINLKRFGAGIENELESPILILFANIKLFIQRWKRIRNTRLIKEIDNVFNEVKNKSRKATILLQ